MAIIPKPPKPTNALGAVCSKDSELLYRKFGPRLYDFVCRLTKGHTQNAEDVVHETFAEALGSPPTMMQFPLAYLRKIAHRVLRRAEVLADRQGITYDSDRVDAIADSPGFQNESLEDELNIQTQLCNSLSRLPRAQYLAVYHCKVLGMTHEEASAATGISVHMIRKHLIRAATAIYREKLDL